MLHSRHHPDLPRQRRPHAAGLSHSPPSHHPGAEFRCYTADITRTFPASGAFTPQARSVYDLSLGMQAVALRGIAPGADWRAAVEEPARRLMLEGLRDMGLVKGDVEVRPLHTC